MCDELKPCPLCGGDIKIERESQKVTYRVVCDKCGAQLSGWHTAEGAEKHWKWSERPKDRGPKLRRCPVCGYYASSVYRSDDNGNRAYYVQCCESDCGFRTPYLATEEGAVDFWNGDLKFENLLKPCPICGGMVRMHNPDDSYKMRVECTQCHCHLDSWDANDKQIRERWNAYELPVKRSPAVKSCPICGTAAQYGYINGKHYVSCDNTACWFQTPLVDTQQEAADIWNGEMKNG